MFFITGGHKRKISGNDNLPKVGIEGKQKKCPQPICSVSQPPFESKWNKPYLPSDKTFNKPKELFSRVGKISNHRKVAHFNSPFKPVQAKGRRVLLRLLAGVNEELGRKETEGHIINLKSVTKIVLLARLS